jgi:hypothetical protein
MWILNKIEELGDFIERVPKISGFMSRMKPGANVREIAHEVRIFAGSPDFLTRGAGYAWTNSVFLFSNAITQGIRGDHEGAFTNPKTRSGYWWKTAKVNILPKILMMLAAAGFFGRDKKEEVDGITEFDKANYIDIPFGRDESGKTIYIRIPQDETGRIIGAIFWKAMNIDKQNIEKALYDISSIASGQIPSFSPLIELVTNIGFFATGKNPVDWFRGGNVLTDEEQRAGGWYRIKPMLGWIAGKMGFYGLSLRAQRQHETTVQKVVRFTPIVQRFVKISDYGKDEIENRELKKAYAEDSREQIEKKEFIEKTPVSFRGPYKEFYADWKMLYNKTREGLATPEEKAKYKRLDVLNRQIRDVYFKNIKTYQANNRPDQANLIYNQITKNLKNLGY